MFTRSKKATPKKKRVVEKPAKIRIIKSGQSEAVAAKPQLDLATAKISIIKPEPGLKIRVEEEVEGEDE